MKQIIILLISLSLLWGCTDSPYREKPEPIPLKTKSYSFSGRVELGTPVYNAQVQAFGFAGLSQGELLGEATSNRDGSYDLILDTAYSGPVLLVARTGMYRDLATREDISFKPDQSLQSIITHIDMPETVNINAWTTLAVARVQADRGFWDSSVAELEDLERINVDFAHISQFLTGESVRFVNIRRQEFFDCEKNSFKSEEPSSKLHVAHGGLSVMAQNMSRKLADAGQEITVMDLIEKLRDDASDRIFDGRNPSGAVVYVGNTSRINLSSYTMRKQLAEAILLYTQRLQGHEQAKSLTRPGHLVDAISRDKQPELFPEAEEPKPIDTNKPKLEVRFAGDHAHEAQFAFLAGPVFFNVEAFDDTEVAQVEVLAPQIEHDFADSSFGPIRIEQVHNAHEVAEVCDKTKEFEHQLNIKNIDASNVICACFKAKDIFGHSDTALFCFQRPEWQTTFGFPTSETILSSADIAEGVVVEANVTSGVPIELCLWEISESQTDHFVTAGDGIIDGTNCTIEEVLDTSDFTNGEYYLEIIATDIFGRTIDGDTESARTDFRIVKEPPTVTILELALNGYISESYIPVQGYVAHANSIREMKVLYWGLSESNHDISGSTLVNLQTGQTQWRAQVGTNLPAGEYACGIFVRDIYGNEQKIPYKKVILDNQAPSITSAVPQIPYRQETTHVNQKWVESESTPRYVVEPRSAARVIDWHGIPTIYRWLPHINDISTAPVYRFRVHDETKLKSVSYQISDECLSEPKSARKLTAAGDIYEIPIVQANAAVDLSQNSQNNKYCLSIWATDAAGSINNHTVEFIWQVILPPLAVDMNAGRYRADRKKNDITSVSVPLKNLFRKRGHLKLRASYALAHAIIANPYPTSLMAELELMKPLQFQLTRQKKYEIGPGELVVTYYSYNLKHDKLGEVKELSGKRVLLNAGETIVALFRWRALLFLAISQIPVGVFGAVLKFVRSLAK